MKWISIKDKLPKEGQWVLVYYGSAFCKDNRMVTVCSWVHAMADSELCIKITHWMPVPEAPENEPLYKKSTYDPETRIEITPSGHTIIHGQTV